MRKSIELPQKKRLRICKLYSLFTLAQPQASSTLAQLLSPQTSIYHRFTGLSKLTLSRLSICDSDSVI